ncbi:MAG: PEP-CTERM sorting domain-containing protein [Verrucomicrobiota bacterium]
MKKQMTFGFSGTVRAESFFCACLLALGCATPVWGQIAYTSYTGATVESGTASAYMGFNPATGAFGFADSWSGLESTYNDAIIGNNTWGYDVAYLNMGAAGVSAQNPNVFPYASGGYVSYVAANSVIDASINPDMAGLAGLGALGIGDTGFMALLVQDGSGNDYYGWAEIQRNADQTYTLLATAYDTVPNESILAGQGLPVPEPSTLALAGLGGLSLLLFRRRNG